MKSSFRQKEKRLATAGHSRRFYSQKSTSIQPITSPPTFGNIWQIHYYTYNLLSNPEGHLVLPVLVEEPVQRQVELREDEVGPERALLYEPLPGMFHARNTTRGGGEVFLQATNQPTKLPFFQSKFCKIISCS